MSATSAGPSCGGGGARFADDGGLGGRDGPPAAGSGGATTGTGGASGTGGAGRGGAAGTGGARGTGGSGSGGAGGTRTASTLKDAAGPIGRLVGVALNTQYLTEAAYANTAGAEFNFVTPENEMKWSNTETRQGLFSFAGGDAVVTFANQHGMQVKGHTLVWHNQLPAWVSALTGAATVQAAMVNHITQVMTHFKGKVVAWDVVNEAWNDDGASLRSDVFTQQIGDSFIDVAFQAARAADPNAILIYNDFGAEGNSAKANSVFTMVQSMKARGIPIDAVGMQMHTGSGNGGPSIAQFQANMQRIAALGLEVYVSELDVQICTSTTAAQQTRFHDVVAACVAQAACGAVTVWGVTDKLSWLNGMPCATPQPLLYDDNYVAKPAFTGMLNALLGQ